LVEVSEVNVQEKFEEFFKQEKYRNLIKQMAVAGKNSIVVDFLDLSLFDSKLAIELQNNPEKYLQEYMIPALKAQLRIEDKQYAEIVDRLYVRIKGLPEKVSLRAIGAKHIGKLISFDGIVVRSTPVRPLLLEATFKCKKCGAEVSVPQHGTFIKAPKECPNPSCRMGKESGFELEPEKSKFIDSQELRVQEKPEDLPPGQLPRYIEVFVVDELVDVARPGDRVVITGVVKARPETVPGKGKLRSFLTYVEANHIETLGKELETVEISPEDEKKILEIAKRDFVHRDIMDSIAPSIYGYDDIKEAIMYLLFGGVPKVTAEGIPIRGDIHVLLVGDPGTAKSQILKYVAKIAPRGLYTSGRGTTAAGLTAAVLREKAGGMVLEAGALVLADKGVACIDEIDKMRDEDRVAMHEMMEQQSYHPLVEIMLANGSKIKIGDYVENLFKKFSNEVIKGVNCEILPLKFSDEIYSVNPLKKIVIRTKINRVSRHKAPDKFVKIRFSNGREILVTPEHPVYVCRDGKIKTIDALNIKVGDFVPAPRELPNSSIPVELKQVPQTFRNEKTVNLPKKLTAEIAKILGYLVTEGHFYKGVTCEIGFANTNNKFLSEFSHLFTTTFDIKPYISINKDGVTIQRYVSQRLYTWLLSNFPEIIQPSRFRRVPSKIFASSKKVIAEFLKSAFFGDGSVESTAICYRTSSRGLAEDYQDLLLKLGISSRLVHDRTSNSYKVYICGDSAEKFFKYVVSPKDPRYEKIKSLVRCSKKTNRHHDILPTSVTQTIIKLLKDLGLPYNGYFNEHLKKGYGVTVQTFRRYLSLLTTRARELQNLLINLKFSSIKELRNKLNFSQRKLAEIVGVRRSVIDYVERGGYSEEKRSRILFKAITKIKEHLLRVNSTLSELEFLLRFRFLRVSSVEIVLNEGEYKTEWVYDVTVEPFHNFVSHGVLLHNTVSVAKGGIVATLNARASILAAANPKFGRYEDRLSVAENIDIPIVILSRFDLIFIQKDYPEKTVDEKLSDHILTVHRTGGSASKPPIQPELLRKYITYARSRVNPRLTEEAINHLREFYLKMREMSGSGEGTPVAITPRQLEALIRIAEARARAALREEVTKMDAEAAIRIMRRSLRDVGALREEVADIDVIMTGKPATLREGLTAVLKLVGEMEKESGEAELEELYSRLESEYGIDRGKAEGYVRQLIKDGSLYFSDTEHKHVRRTKG